MLRLALMGNLRKIIAIIFICSLFSLFLISESNLLAQSSKSSARDKDDDYYLRLLQEELRREQRLRQPTTKNETDRGSKSTFYQRDGKTKIKQDDSEQDSAKEYKEFRGYRLLVGDEEKKKDESPKEATKTDENKRKLPLKKVKESSGEKADKKEEKQAK